MLEVFCRRNASNGLPVMWTIGELGISHIRHDVGGSFGGAREAAYLAMNPNGRIPTLRDGGFVLWESNAIVRYLCRCYDRGELLLPADERGYALADQWMDWHKTTLYPTYIDWFWAVVRTEPAIRDYKKIAELRERMELSLEILDGQLGKAGFVLGDKLSMADIPFGPLVFRYFELVGNGPSFRHIRNWYGKLQDRAAFREHVMFPFGSNPGEWYLLERELGRVTQ